METGLCAAYTLSGTQDLRDEEQRSWDQVSPVPHHDSFHVTSSIFTSQESNQGRFCGFPLGFHSCHKSMTEIGVRGFLGR